MYRHLNGLVKLEANLPDEPGLCYPYSPQCPFEEEQGLATQISKSYLALWVVRLTHFRSEILIRTI